MNSAESAAESATVAIIFRPAVANWAQTKSGMRVSVIPGARILKIVTMKFSPVKVELTPIKMMAMHQSVVPGGPCSETGGYSVQPASGAPTKNEANKSAPAGGKSQKLNMLSHGNATSRAPIMRGMMMLPKPPVTSGIVTNQTIAVPCML